MSASGGESGRTLIVTGASRGIGAAVARLAAAEGYAVAVNYSRDASGAASVVDDIRSAGGRAAAIQADISEERNVIDLFEKAVAELGPLNGLVNNAGSVGPLCRVADISAAALDEVLRLNVTSVFLCCREAVRRLSTLSGGAGGSIVNISSRAAVLGGAGEWVHYAASKGAIDSLTIGLAKEVGAEGIRVNAVSPGLIHTGLHAAAGAPERLEKAPGTVPLGRTGSPEEVAEAVLWLLSPAAAYVTGANIDVSGGR